MALSRGSSTARAEPPQVTVINATLFRGLVESLQEDRRRVILDLGPVRPEVVNMLGGLRCRLEIADLAQQLAALNGAAEPAELEAAVESSLPPAGGEPIDTVFCWDLLNYLDRPALTAMMRAIRRRLAAGARLHALIVYSTPRMPPVPARIAPDAEHRLVHVPPPGEWREAPRYNSEDIAKCMPGYSVERAMLLRNGMQEFLLRH
jgi:hypothetical protein